MLIITFSTVTNGYRASPGFLKIFDELVLNLLTKALSTKYSFLAKPLTQPRTYENETHLSIFCNYYHVVGLRMSKRRCRQFYFENTNDRCPDGFGGSKYRFTAGKYKI